MELKLKLKKGLIKGQVVIAYLSANPIIICICFSSMLSTMELLTKRHYLEIAEIFIK